MVLHDFLALMYAMAGVSVGTAGQLNGTPIPRGMAGKIVRFGPPLDWVLQPAHFDEKLVISRPSHGLIGTRALSLSIYLSLSLSFARRCIRWNDLHLLKKNIWVRALSLSLSRLVSWAQVRRLEAWTLQYVLVQPLLACLHLATLHHAAALPPQSTPAAHALPALGNGDSSFDGADGSWASGGAGGEAWLARCGLVASLGSTTLSLSALVGFYHTFEQANTTLGLLPHLRAGKHHIRASTTPSSRQTPH